METVGFQLHGIMSEQTINVNANAGLPAVSTMPSVPIEPFTDGFVDTGIIANLEIPFVINQSRKTSFRASAYPSFDDPSIASTNRVPLLGILNDPFINHDLQGPFSPIIYPDPTWTFNNTQMIVRAYGLEHPLVRLASSFVGWKGSLDWMITINSTALVQGELAIVRAKYAGGGAIKWRNILLEFEEPDNNQIVNLSAEKRIVKFVSFTESTTFINTMQYWLARNGLPYSNVKPMNLYRNWIFIRPNTDINTLSPNGGTISFKFYLKHGSDFQFLFPSVPIRPDIQRRLSVIDRKIPFPITHSLIVAQRPYAGTTTNRPIILDDSAYETSVTVPETGLTVRNFPTGYVGFVDVRKYDNTAFPEWTAIAGYQYGWIDVNNSFQVNIRIVDTFVTLIDIPNADLVYGKNIFEFHMNTAPDIATAPPYFFP